MIQREFQTPGGAMVQSGKPLANRPLRPAGPRAAAILAIALASSGPLWAADPVFSAKATESCAAAAAAASPALSDHAVLDCVGRAAQACMMTPGGDTTYGMMECLDGERRYWDDRLNTAFAARVATAQQQDKELRDLGSAAATIEQSLRDMQRAWIAFHDKACLYEQSLWMGGTGGGPATMACHMHETARQALKLEGWWGE